MSSDTNNPNDMNYRSTHRRGSITSAAFTGLFRSNSVSQGTQFPGPITSAAMTDQQRRRLSISTLGLSGTSPSSASSAPFARRASLSTNNSDSIDENAIEEEDSARTAPTTPFTRRMSFGTNTAMRNMRAGGGSPGTYDQGFNWSEQLRSRAESTVAGSRPTFGFGSGGMSASPPRGAHGGGVGGSAPNTYHDRSKSVSDMPAPPAQTPRARQPQKPDHFQERILKGDFYMD